MARSDLALSNGSWIPGKNGPAALEEQAVAAFAALAELADNVSVAEVGSRESPVRLKAIAPT